MPNIIFIYIGKRKIKSRIFLNVNFSSQLANGIIKNVGEVWQLMHLELFNNFFQIKRNFILFFKFIIFLYLFIY